MSGKADKPDAPAAAEKPAAKPTRYEISEARAGDKPGVRVDSWLPVATVEASGARAAIREYVEGLGDKFAGCTLRAVPVSNITQVTVKVETARKLTLA